MNHFNQRIILTMSFVVSCLVAMPAQANLIEQILNNPRVQALLGKPAEILNQSKQCEVPTFRKSNAQLCTDVDNAASANKMPFEMRTVMTNRTSAQALRDLCLAAQTTAQQSNYLCAELGKADKNFAAAAAAARATTGTTGNSSLNDLSN